MFRDARLKPVLVLTSFLGLGIVASLGFRFPGAYFWTAAAFVGFIYLLINESHPKGGALDAFSFGIGYFASGLTWVFHSVYVYGNAPWLFAALSVLALSAVLSLFPAAAGYLAVKIRVPNALKASLLIPLLWTGAEFLRGEWVGGFGWLSVGYAFTDNMLSSWAPILGVYGVTLVILLTVGGASGVLMRSEALATRLLSGLICVTAVLGAYALKDIAWSSPTSRLEVRLVQPDLPVTTRATYAMQQKALERVEAMSLSHPLGRPLDLILWPESVYAFLPASLPEAWKEIPQKVAQKQGSEVLFNAFSMPKKRAIANTLYLANADQTRPIYSKRHLVPFGEFVPYGFRWMVDALAIPMADQVPGSAPSEPVSVAGIPTALGICYENMFPAELTDWFNVGNPNLIIYSANLGWFSEDAVREFSQMSRMRAKEAARPVLQVINNAGSALFDPTGVELRRAGLGAQNLDVTVRLYGGTSTPFMRYGFAVFGGIWALLFATIFGFCRLANRFSRKSEV